MEKYYADEKNSQLIVSLLKEHGVKRIVASPGTTNIPFVRCVQIDPYFEVYSSADERSASYIACGIAYTTKEPVVISCTGATASRNYLPGITEAFYRKLPVLAITSSRDETKYGHHEDQVIDRSIMPKDTYKLSVSLPTIKDNDDLWYCNVNANKAILELFRNGNGPVHVNLNTAYTRTYTTKELPKFRKIERFTVQDNLPKFKNGKIGIFVGSHHLFTDREIKSIEDFCGRYNSVVFCDHTSSYNGKFKITFPLVMLQQGLVKDRIIPETLIHIGEISGFYSNFVNQPSQVWRVNEDGEIRDTFKKLNKVFEMSEQAFFENYSELKSQEENTYYTLCKEKHDEIQNKIPELPFSNIWIASKLYKQIPNEAIMHFGILNSLSSWNYFELSSSIETSSNVGGFGIDGCVSAFIGSSMVNSNKLHFGVFGDLAFFYDMNVLGNRHIGNNVRILLVNNGKGMEFKIKNNPGVQFGDETDEFVSAARHYGNKSEILVKNYAEGIGFEYICANSKEEFDQCYMKFISTNEMQKPILFEVFTNDIDERNAHIIMTSIATNVKGKTKQITKKLLGETGFNLVKKVIK